MKFHRAQPWLCADFLSLLVDEALEAGLARSLGKFKRKGLGVQGLGSAVFFFPSAMGAALSSETHSAQLLRAEFNRHIHGPFLEIHP